MLGEIEHVRSDSECKSHDDNPKQIEALDGTNNKYKLLRSKG